MLLFDVDRYSEAILSCAQNQAYHVRNDGVGLKVLTNYSLINAHRKKPRQGPLQWVRPFFASVFSCNGGSWRKIQEPSKFPPNKLINTRVPIGRKVGVYVATVFPLCVLTRFITTPHCVGWLGWLYPYFITKMTEQYLRRSNGFCNDKLCLFCIL